MVDLSKIRPGDHVTVRMLVLGVEDGGERLRLGRDSVSPNVNAWAWADDWKVVEHRATALLPGERVVFVGIHGERSLNGTVIHVHEGMAWVQWDRSAGVAPILGLGSLERA